MCCRSVDTDDVGFWRYFGALQYNTGWICQVSVVGNNWGFDMISGQLMSEKGIPNGKWPGRVGYDVWWQGLMAHMLCWHIYSCAYWRGVRL